MQPGGKVSSAHNMSQQMTVNEDPGLSHHCAHCVLVFITQGYAMQSIRVE
jgi:hypothetical protein